MHLTAAVCSHLSIAAGAAALDLEQAEHWADRACHKGSDTRAAWKLMGDVQTAYYFVDPCSAKEMVGISSMSTEKLISL